MRVVILGSGRGSNAEAILKAQVAGQLGRARGVQIFAEKVGARLIVTGHQPQDTGWFANGDQHLIIASDHSQGVFLPLSLSERYDMEEMTGKLKKFVSIDLDALQEVTEDDGG